MNPRTLALIEEAKRKHAARLAAMAAAKPAEQEPQSLVQSALIASGTISNPNTLPATVINTNTVHGKLEFNKEQQAAILCAEQGKDMCLIGAAGTGKTTVTQEIISRLQRCAHVSPISSSTKYLSAGVPGVVVVGFTNKAVNNIKKRLPPHLAKHCLTIHKLLEYGPDFYEEPDGEGNMVNKMRFVPSFNMIHKLPHISTIISEESSMTGLDLWGQLLDALPNAQRTQFIMLGDLNQLPPIFGPSILGFKLLELQTVELTHVYRQALQSPIISLATAIRLNTVDKGFNPGGKAWHERDTMELPRNLTEPVTIDRGEHGKLTIHPWKQRVESESAMHMMKKFLPGLIDSGKYNPEEDMILCPFNKSFGTVELNKIIADHLAKKRRALVYEIRARYELHYLAAGDRVLYDRHDAVITKITKTVGYTGKPVRDESLTLDRWGRDPNSDLPPSKLSHEELMNMMDNLAGADEDSKNLCSHTIHIRIPDTEEIVQINTAGEVNKLLMGYALTVHKSQGSEWERVFFFLHNSHGKGSLLSRELVYTAVTRAKKELYIICEGDKGKFMNSLIRAADRPVIVGTTLAEKAEYFKGKAKSLGLPTGDE